MRFEILGPFRVLDGDTDVELGGPRQQRVLASLLAAAPDALSVDRLVDEVWGQRYPDTASHVIRTYISGLRKVLGDRISSDGRHYQIDTSTDSIDASEFADALDRARSVLPSDPAKASMLLREASALWRGRPFGDLADEAPLVALRATELEELHTQSIELLVAAELALGRHEQLIPELESLIRLHPYREKLHRHLMLALYRSGRQVEALRVGWDLRNMLVEEVGLEPSTETRTLEDRILLQDPELDLRPPSNLPAFVSSFVGRDWEAAEVVDLVDDHRLVTLIGVGGVGKTRLAREVGSQVLGCFPDGVWWVDLAVPAPGTDVVGRTVEVFGLAGQPGVEAETLLVRYLAHRSALLVFDNCERMTDDVANLATVLLEGAPHLKILTTSRLALNAPGEKRYPVYPLGLPSSGEPLGLSDAELLFTERSRQVDERFVPNPVEAAEIASICRTLEGLPLAIELAAGRIGVLSPAQIADHLDDRFRFLVAAGPAASRQQSLAATIDWSYELLTTQQQKLFDRLSIFLGPFDLAAAEAVAGPDHDIVDGITALVDASMIERQRSDGTIRYRLLDTLRDYGRTRIADHGDLDTTAQRHSRHFIEMARHAADLWFTPDHPAVMRELGIANADLQAALDWSLEHDPRSVTLTAAPGLVGYWFWRGDPASASRYGAQMLEGADGLPVSEVAAAHICAAFGAQLLGHFDVAEQEMGTALQMLHGNNNWKLLLWAYNGVGQGAVFAGPPALTTDMGRRVLELCETHDAKLACAYGYALLGEGEFFSDGDFNESRQATSEAIPLLRELGDEAALNMFALGILSAVSALQLDFEAAEQAGMEASTLGGPGWSATALILLGGCVFHPRGEIERAETTLRTGLVRTHERSMEVWTRTGLLFLGRIAAQRGRWEHAARLFGGCRPQLPLWVQHPRWWNYEPAVREALGDEEYERISTAGAAEPLDDLVAWATGR
jgi:predicted ATPase/DNA-binding SARP family transcriptional activator